MLVSSIVLFIPLQSYAQERSCEEVLVEANEMYSRGAFDETIALLDLCIENSGVSDAQRKTAFRLKGLSFIGKGLEVDARESIRRLIQLVPNYEPDPVMDPPNFVQLIAEVKQEIDAELNAAGPPSEEATPVVDESAVLEAPPPATVTSGTTKRKKKGSTKWIIGGLGVVAAGGLVAVLASGGGGSSGSGTIAEPPALP